MPENDNAPQTATIRTATAAAFLAMWDGATAERVATVLECDEADTIANLLADLGAAGRAEIWLALHESAAGCDEVHPSPSLDDVGGHAAAPTDHLCAYGCLTCLERKQGRSR